MKLRDDFLLQRNCFLYRDYSIVQVESSISMTSLVESELNDIFEGVITLTSKRKIISEDIFPRLVLASKDQR